MATYSTIAEFFHAGIEKTNLSVFPIVGSTTGLTIRMAHCIDSVNWKEHKNNPNFKNYKKVWRETGVLNGENAHGIILKTWEDLFRLSEAELKTQASILEAIFAEDKIAAHQIYYSLNNSKTELVGFDLENDEDLDAIEKLCRGISPNERTGFLGDVEVRTCGMDDDPEKSPTTKLETWLPTWTAWKHFKSVFSEMYVNKQLLLEYYK